MSGPAVAAPIVNPPGGAQAEVPESQRRVRTLTASASLAAAGGYLDAFTFLGHGHVFANAMTGNIILLAADAVEASWRDALRHLLPIIMFLLGVGAARAVCHPGMRRWLNSPEIAVLWVEIVAFSALGLVPTTASSFIETLTIAFVASMQTETFREINGRSYSSTFTTGNLRTMVENAFDWLFNGHQPKHLTGARDFATICFMFFFGALIGAMATPRLHNHALWLDVLVLIWIWLWLRWPATPAKLTHPAAG